jgi:hypothetical protein
MNSVRRDRALIYRAVTATGNDDLAIFFDGAASQLGDFSAAGRRRIRAGVPFSANIRESFSRTSGPGWQPEVLLRMQVRPEDATWFSLFSDRRISSLADAFEHWNQQQ